jgi:hypothetical protein
MMGEGREERGERRGERGEGREEMGERRGGGTCTHSSTSKTCWRWAVIAQID